MKPKSKASCQARDDKILRRSSNRNKFKNRRDENVIKLRGRAAKKRRSFLKNLSGNRKEKNVAQSNNVIWLNSCLQLEINDQIAKKWFQKIENKLTTESHRFFHTWNKLINNKEQYIKDVKPIIIFALFFQYYEFNVQHNLTEKNCSAFLEFCNEANFSDETVISHVRKLLGDDSIEEYTGYREDINFIQDLNLLILSSSSEEYETYCDLIRKEYDYLSDSSFNAMRLKSSECLLGTNLGNESSSFMNHSKSSPSSSVNQSNIRKRKTISKISPNTNMINISARKIKQRLRNVYMSQRRKRKIDTSFSTTDDCVLIEIPPEVIVIDDDTAPTVMPLTENASLVQDISSQQNSDKQNVVVNSTGEETYNESGIRTIQEIDEMITISTASITFKDTIIESEFANSSSLVTQIEDEKNDKNEANGTLISDSVIKIDDNKNISVVVNDTTFTDDKSSRIPPIYEISKNNSHTLGENMYINSSRRRHNARHTKRGLLEKRRKEEEMALCKKNPESTKTQSHTTVILADNSNNKDDAGIETLSFYSDVEGDQTKVFERNTENEDCCNLPEYLFRQSLFYKSRNKGRNTKKRKSKVQCESDKNSFDSKIRNEVKINIEDDDDDESVIFMGEVQGSSQTSSDFIPLPFVDDTKKMRRKKRPLINPPSQLFVNPFKKFKRDLQNRTDKISTPKSKSRAGEIEFTDSEKKKNEKYNSNTYNPNKDETIKKSEKRMIIIDGSNVAFGHANCTNFSSRGLEIAINFFESKGHEVKAVVPKFRCNHYKSTDGNKLIELNRCGKIVFTPGKNLPDLKASSYDDRFTLQLALEFDAAIVSNDNYRDLINENPGFKKLIENRVITYTWCNDLFIVAKDPYGKIGPTLEQILNRNIDSK